MARMMTRAKRLLAVGIAASALVVTGCGAPQDAATIDGETYSVQDVQERTDNLNAAVGSEMFTPVYVVTVTVDNAIAQKVAAEFGMEATDEQLMGALLQQGVPAQLVMDPQAGEVLKDDLFSKAVQQQVPPAEYARIADEVDVQVNPRYGSLDANGYFAAGGSLSVRSPQTMLRLQEHFEEQAERRDLLGG